ncbi:MAG: PQQ-like beta-propeller repeat protein [Spirochaetales bacterium]|nr:PQQ-like beta-propeller repeat protein [Spirochaetales bacterium]
MRQKPISFLLVFFLILTVLASSGCKKKIEETEHQEQLPVIEKEEKKEQIYNWPNYRGPDMDGISKEKSLLPARLDDEDVIKWEKNIGYGFAGITIYGERLFTMGLEKIKGNTKEGNDIVYCFHVDTGEELWRYSYICTIGMHPGPRTAPTIDNNHVYTLSRDGDLYCLDYTTGKVIWYHDIVSEYHAVIPQFGFSAAPVVDNDLLIINARAYGIAFQKDTGEVVWMSPEGKCGYAVIPVFTWRTGRYAAVFSDNALFIIDVLTGSKLSSFPWATYSGCNVGIPIIFDNKIFISSSYDYGCALLELTDDAVLKTVWRNKAVKHHMSAGILFNGTYFGNDGFYNKRAGSFKAVDIMTGEEKWKEEDGVGSVTGVDDKLILLTDRGKLTIAKRSAESYQPVISKDLGRGTWFTPPTFCRGCLYIRNRNGRFICLDLNKKQNEKTREMDRDEAPSSGS